MSTALDRINIRRFMFLFDKQIRQKFRRSYFERYSPEDLMSFHKQCVIEVLKDFQKKDFQRRNNKKKLRQITDDWQISQDDHKEASYFDFKIEQINSKKIEVIINFCGIPEPVSYVCEWKPEGINSEAT